MHLKLAVLLLALPLLLPAGARAETYFKGEHVVALCEAPGNDSPAIGKRNLCTFYIAAVSDALVTSSLYARAANDSSPLAPVLCLPDNVSPDELSSALSAHAKAHRAEMRGSAARLAADAFLARYPCPDAAQSGQENTRQGTKPDVVFFSAGDLLPRCSDADALTGLYCLYYVVGVSDLYDALASGQLKAGEPNSGEPKPGDASPFARQICFPPDMPDEQPRRAFVTYMAVHPGAQGDNAALTSARALHAAFPCPAR